MRELRVGDIIHVQGITCTIAEIAWQEPWDWYNAYHTEFRDTNGVYRSWKQNIDGGYAEHEYKKTESKKYIDSYGMDVTDIFKKYGY